MTIYEITAEMNLKKIIDESREAAQALNAFANNLERIDKKYAKPLESGKKPSWLGKNCKDCGNKKCKELGTLPKGYDCALWQAKSENK